MPSMSTDRPLCVSVVAITTSPRPPRVLCAQHWWRRRRWQPAPSWARVSRRTCTFHCSLCTSAWPLREQSTNGDRFARTFVGAIPVVQACFGRSSARVFAGQGEDQHFEVPSPLLKHSLCIPCLDDRAQHSEHDVMLRKRQCLKRCLYIYSKAAVQQLHLHMHILWCKKPGPPRGWE